MRRLNRILNTVGRIATGISVGIIVLGVILLLAHVISGPVYQAILFLTVPLGVVSAIVALMTGE
jgi:hypothetical protein